MSGQSTTYTLLPTSNRVGNCVVRVRGGGMAAWGRLTDPARFPAMVEDMAERSQSPFVLGNCPTGWYP